MNLKEYKSMSDTIQSLDEKDLGLMEEDMNEIIWGDVDKENDLVESEQL